MLKVQTTITGKAESLYGLLAISKKKAVEQAIILLAQDKKLAPIFFDDMTKVEAILTGADDNNAPTTQKAASPKKQEKTPSPKIKTAWE